MDTLAWETSRTLCNRVSFTDPETGEKLNSTALYLALLFDWQGWAHPVAKADRHFGGPSLQVLYSTNHKSDKWDQAPLLRIDFLALRKALGMPEGDKYVTPAWLGTATIEDTQSHKKASFLVWAQRLGMKKREGFSVIEKKALELVSKYGEYQTHRMGNSLYIVPVKGNEEEAWLSVADLMQSKFNDKTDPTGGLRKVKEHLQTARTAYVENKPDEFNQATSAFIAAVTDLGPKLGPYPDQATIDLEVSYNRWAPFRFAWILTAVAFVSFLLHMGSKWKALYTLGLASFVASLVAMFVGFGLRMAISGRAPVTNMYESVTYVGLGAAVCGLIFELIYRKRFVVTAAAAVATVSLILADNCPAVLDPSIRPLQPVLRSNFWLVTHVMSITLSYATFALALGIGNITLGYYLVGSRNREVTGELSTFTYKSLQVGVFLLAVGTILGAVWADYSWGRFWGWDPKEVWALIALLGYLAVLHARYVDWVRDFGLAALSVICFSLVVMAWYGVNFVLGAGLHSYGFGGGGEGYVYAAVGAQFLFVIAAAIRRAFSRETPKTPEPSSP